MSTTYLITGSAGFIGSNLIRSILYNQKDCKIISVDSLERLDSRNNLYINKAHEFQVGNICDRDFIVRMTHIYQPDIIINLAKPNLYREDLVEARTKGVFNLIEASGFQKTNPLKHFIQVSCADVYGEEPRTRPITENECVDPQTLKASLNVASENIVRTFNKDLPYTILRLPQVFGMRQAYGFVPAVIYDSANGHSISLIEKGTKVRELLYIEDLYYAITTILTSDHSKQETYNVSCGNDFTDAELVALIASEATDSVITLQNEQRERDDIFDYGFYGSYVKLNTDKIRSLGWKPQKLREKLKFTVGWYKNNPWIFK